MVGLLEREMGPSQFVTDNNAMMLQITLIDEVNIPEYIDILSRAGLLLQVTYNFDYARLIE